MSKYGRSIGIWELSVGRTKEDGPLNLKPKKGDNLALARILGEGEKNSLLLLEKFKDWLVKLIAREHPPINDEEKNELEEYVEFNLMDLMTETLVVFRWATREQIEKKQEEIIKKAMPQ